ncbi:MAG: GMC oxidoreductase [Myxococcales bacterium]
MKPSYQVVVIGSGAGGAPIANVLGKSPKGISVLVLEKGPLLRPQGVGLPVSDFKRDELYATGPEKRISIPGMRNGGDSYYSSHVEPDLNDEPHVYFDPHDARRGDWATIEGYTAQVVGGGTQLYGAVSLRFPPRDFQLRSVNAGRALAHDSNDDVHREARDWPIQYDELEPYYCMAEELVGINGTVQNQGKPFSRDCYQEPIDTNPISGFVETGMDALRMPRYRTPLAVITQDHEPSGRKAGKPKTGYVNRYGDPMAFKSNTYVSLLRPVLGLPNSNVELRCNCTVTHLEDDGNGKIRRVWFRDEGGAVQSVGAGVVVVACSAIESVRLLLLSGEASPSFKERLHPQTRNGGRKDLLGRYFLTHCFGGAETVVPARFDKSLSLDSDWATDFCTSPEFLDEMQLWAGGAIYNNTSAHALPIALARTHGSQDIDTIWTSFNETTELTGEKLAGYFDQCFGTQLSISFMANQVPLPSNRIELHPSVKDKWGRPVAYILKDWHEHDRYLMDMLAEQCRKILAYGLDPASGSKPVDGWGGVYRADNGVARIANHILGGARFGDDRDDSVLDPQCRVWDFLNLFVTDGSFMPTSGSGNPTLTIQANAFRVGSYLERQL